MVYIFSIAHQIKPIINYDQSWQEVLDPLKEYIQSWYNSIIIFFFQLSISNLASPSISFSVIIRIEQKQDYYCLWCHLLQLQFDHHQVIIYRENFWAWLKLQPGFFANSHSTWTIKRKFLYHNNTGGNQTLQKVVTQCVKGPFLSKKIQILEKLKKWSISALYQKLTFFSS